MVSSLLRLPFRSALFILTALLGSAAPLSPALAQQVQLRCDGTLLEAQGSAELKRDIQRLGFSLGLEAEAGTADEALGALQQRLAAVRSTLQRLAVQDLEVTSPATYTRPAQRGRPALTSASLRVSGVVAPARLQSLVREVGGLPGVRLAPVTPQADASADPAVRRQLLRAAYQDALAQAREMVQAMGLGGAPVPLQVQIQSGFRPVPLARAALDAAAAPPFDPAELPDPVDRLELMARFCVR
ncbi:SIMPL domain-containing protein [Cyanobium sp. CH-040]|uniref:SIMPL domain-containing protein n=1 Tax=Cyanobium sp. CH-040 TaxID=2823708 RepID=UPI0020CF2292|nr:SIMPL domain-containing protein [Cyanobium sp. CH-040]MCP9928357.1 SIMPL domain-containing protein [Cyanobium sp. CH-040]